MPIVIAGGKSVTDYDGLHLANLARLSLTFAVNDSAFLWPCDIVVALDPDWIVKRKANLTTLGKPIITRKWAMLKDSGLDLMELPNAIPWRLSGIAACVISDKLCAKTGSKSYVIGMDHRAGHYYNDESDCSKVVEIDEYAKLNLTNTINLGIHSRISCWPKQSKLPHVKKVLTTKAYRAIATAWIRGEIEMGRMTK